MAEREAKPAPQSPKYKFDEEHMADVDAILVKNIGYCPSGVIFDSQKAARDFEAAGYTISVVNQGENDSVIPASFGVVLRVEAAS